MPKTVLHWFRRDLRLDDNPALLTALTSGDELIPIYIHDAKEQWGAGGASRVWLHHSLQSLGNTLAKRGSQLILRSGSAVEELMKLVRESGTSVVTATRHVGGDSARIEVEVGKELAQLSVEFHLVEGETLFTAEAIRTKQGGPYKVFTPFWRMAQTHPEPPQAQPAPKQLKVTKNWPDSLSLEGLNLLPARTWAASMIDYWQPGEEGARDRMRCFTEEAADSYDTGRDLLAIDGTSRLSPHLHFGELSIRRLWWHVLESVSSSGDRDRYLAELGWRDFAHHILHHFPHTPEKPLDERFSKFPWTDDEELLHAWQSGKTGYPIVDAGMRQLWASGWMHNRVRMIVASFLTKHLLQPWQSGAHWFWETLVDADLANNTLGWQWAAGCGADAAPYFRIFNPVSQGERFDKEGEYVRRWVPELARLDSKWIHHPWDAPAEVLEAAGVRLGVDYPEPIVDLRKGRERALEAWDHFRAITSNR